MVQSQQSTKNTFCSADNSKYTKRKEYKPHYTGAYLKTDYGKSIVDVADGNASYEIQPQPLSPTLDSALLSKTLLSAVKQDEGEPVPLLDDQQQQVVCPFRPDGHSLDPSRTPHNTAIPSSRNHCDGLRVWRNRKGLSVDIGVGYEAGALCTDNSMTEDTSAARLDNIDDEQLLLSLDSSTMEVPSKRSVEGSRSRQLMRCRSRLLSKHDHVPAAYCKQYLTNIESKSGLSGIPPLASRMVSSSPTDLDPVFSTRDLDITLAISMATSMQPDAPLARLAQDDSLCPQLLLNRAFQP